MPALPSKDEIFKVFNAISTSYDKVNRILSLGLDLRWRHAVRKFIPKKPNLSLLDLATGTGDQIFSLLDLNDKLFEKAVGVDLAQDMLAIAKQKALSRLYSDKVQLSATDATNMPFDAASFDMITMSFGIRNVVSIDKTLEEIYRVLKTDGVLVILEFSLPQNRLIRWFYLLYLQNILPFIGRLLSGHPTAYTYLNKTIQTFPCGDAFCAYLNRARFKDVYFESKTFGTVSLYVGKKLCTSTV